MSVEESTRSEDERRYIEATNKSDEGLNALLRKKSDEQSFFKG